MTYPLPYLPHSHSRQVYLNGCTEIRTIHYSVLSSKNKMICSDRTGFEFTSSSFAAVLVNYFMPLRFSFFICKMELIRSLHWIIKKIK